MSAQRTPPRLRLVAPPAPDDPADDARLRGLLRRQRRAGGLRRLGRVTVGFACLVLGFVGLFLPVLQGILLLALGTALLAPDFPPARRLVIGAYRRWPKLRRRVPRALRRMGRTAERAERAEAVDASQDR